MTNNSELIDSANSWRTILENSPSLPRTTHQSIADMIGDLVELTSIMEVEIERLRSSKERDVTPKEVTNLEMIIAEKNRLINDLKDMNNNQAIMIRSYEQRYEKFYNHKNYMKYEYKELLHETDVEFTTLPEEIDYALKA